MANRFFIQQWAAWAPGLDDQSAWRDWLRVPTPVTGEGMPDLPEVPAMTRRRIDRLGRAALQVAFRALGDEAACPIVFSSRYGDIKASVAMLEALAVGETLSPTAFSMSVHNAIGALFSIVRGDMQAYSAVAAGAETVEAAFVEAQGLLADGANAVLVVHYDEPLPDVYLQFADYEDFPHAWACLLRPAEQGGISLSCVAGDTELSLTDLPPDIDVLRFLLSDALHHEHVLDKRTWQWARHD